MGTKTIKISDANYKVLYEFAGELQEDFGEPVSADRAITFLFNRTKLSDLAGSWKMSDAEAREFLQSLRNGWFRWKIK